ncbi:solute carrier family 17 member 9-like isoform X1 [Dreissena polymorpha]|uniref:Major facilitator superfamily (MFS) profile domain-containing protein n=1 Tax=Dreissena polymorpha TaxID=45954 RepID=A0A9D4G552_DREPO|nr:solute carrier family 17 member 9-like isoform X1 [Dreissena polymorpha]KAH3809294.1 hypothetical protein DPMN_137656 [Dreissena polymorpha]
MIEDDQTVTMETRYWNRTEKKQWMIGLFWGCATLYSCRTVMPLVAVPMSKELGWDKTESGSVLSAFFWGYTMTQFLGGYLSDRIGGDVVIPIAACCWSLVTFWTPQLVYLFEDKILTLRLVILSRVLLGVFQGFHYPGVSSLISRKIPEQDRSFTFAVVCSGTQLGTLFCGSVGSFILEVYGWDSVFYFLGLLGMLWMLCMRYFLIHRHRQKYLPFISIEKKPPPPSAINAPTPWVTLFFKPAFWSLLIGHFCENNAFFILLSWLPTYFHENFPDAKGWVFNVVPWLITIPSSIFGGWLADLMITKGWSVTFVRKLMNTITMLGCAFFLVIISYTSSYVGALTCMACAVACCGFHNSGILVNPQDIAPKHAGSVFGIMNMAGAIPGFIGVYMAGHILEATKSWSAVFNQTAGVAVFGWIVYTIFGTGKQII